MPIFYTLRKLVGNKTTTINLADVSWMDDTTVMLRSGTGFKLEDGERLQIIAFAHEQQTSHGTPPQGYMRVTE